MRRGAALLGALAFAASGVLAQGLDLTRGGPVEVTAEDGIEWRQQEQVVIARGNARAVRAGVTVESDRLIARYRPRGGQAPVTPAAGADGSPAGNNEIWRLEAEGSVRIRTATDRANGDRAVYDMDQAVMVLTGRDLWLETPDQRISARDSLEYWAGRRMAVARGGASVVSRDDRRIRADVLVAHFADDPQPGQAPPPRRAAQPGQPGQDSGRVEKVEAFGNVEIRTPNEVVRGDRGVYDPGTGLARLLGNVRITRGDNHLNGQEAIVNLQTGVARLVSAPGQRVQGLIVPEGEGGRPPEGRGQERPR